MDASHISPSILMGIVVVTIVIGVTLGFFAYQSSKNRKKKKTRRS
ncbi:hypothetical protein DYY66_0489 [Candidatus Nitrosotalea sp. FS]|nr:hypothetical protein [Candidatus Nitrosotalea sp. FS]